MSKCRDYKSLLKAAKLRREEIAIASFFSGIGSFQDVEELCRVVQAAAEIGNQFSVNDKSAPTSATNQWNLYDCRSTFW